MAHEHDGWVDFDFACLEGGLVEDVNLTLWSTGGYQVGLFGVVLDSVDLTIVLDLMLHDDHFLH
jgi:hypothetical protein